jgi:hypothetical protein
MQHDALHVASGLTTAVYRALFGAVSCSYGTHVCPGEYLSNVQLELALSGVHLPAWGQLNCYKYVYRRWRHYGNVMRLCNAYAAQFMRAFLCSGIVAGVCDSGFLGFFPVVAALFTRLPQLRLAVPESQIQWSGADKDVGVAALPVTWKVRSTACNASIHGVMPHAFVTQALLELMT